MPRARKWRVRSGSRHERSDLLNALDGLTRGLQALAGFDHGKQANALRGLGFASVTAEAFSGMFGVKVGSGKYTEGMRFPCAANPDGTPVTTPKVGSEVIGINVETGLPLWDYVPENAQVSRADSEREKRKWAARSHLKDVRAEERNAKNREQTRKAWRAICEGRVSTSNVDTRALERELKRSQDGRVTLGQLAGLTEGLRALHKQPSAQPLDLSVDSPVVHAVKARRRAFIVEIEKK